MLKVGFIEQQMQIMADAVGHAMGKDRLAYEMTDPYRNEAANDLNQRLENLLADGKINEAENLLFDAVQNDAQVDHDYLRVALDFYMKMDDYTDDYLALCHFSRQEIMDGWAEITKLF
ncbi:MAG: DUF6483 family protein [Turicibacter sp.]|nr:DUF6483 family protein [Turicibacter sp.]